MILNTLIHLANFSQRNSARTVRVRSFLIMTVLLRTVKLWHSRARQRRQLDDLSDRLLRDIGITRNEAKEESHKWFWRP